MAVLSPIDNFKEGLENGQKLTIDLVNKWCGFHATTVAELILAIQQLQGEDKDD